ncbi:hypothetical protein [Streptomyces massasporeus]|uniref:hypothetical protein n=1 Tax=Streptomyces massasporeus TaxID=67324 RepID=UPI0034087FD0
MRSASLPLLGADEEAVAFFAGVADLDATDPDSHELEEVGPARFRATAGAVRTGGLGGYVLLRRPEERPVVCVSLDGEAGAARGLGLDPAGLPSAATGLARLMELARGPVAGGRRNVPSSGTTAIRSAPC